MAVSMREVDPVFQGAGQKEYPSVSSLLLVIISVLIPLCCLIPRISFALVPPITFLLLFQNNCCCCPSYIQYKIVRTLIGQTSIIFHELSPWEIFVI